MMMRRIYLGRRKGADLVYAGKVDHGFDKTSAAELRRRLTPLIRKTQPYAKTIVEPKLLAEIEYRAKSAEGKVRHSQSLPTTAIASCQHDTAKTKRHRTVFDW